MSQSAKQEDYPRGSEPAGEVGDRVELYDEPAWSAPPCNRLLEPGANTPLG